MTLKNVDFLGGYIFFCYLSELNCDLSLNKYPRIFIAGELMDIDGMCGGYNLQFAWSSAGVIVNSIKERLIKK